MKRMAIALAGLAALTTLSVGTAFTSAGGAGTKATVTGELVDMGCYLSHEAKGEKHASCAAKCISGGMPMGLLTNRGQIYLLTLDHANSDAFNKAKEWAGKQVKVSGPVHVRGGIKAIEVSSAEVLASASAAAK